MLNVLKVLHLLGVVV